MRGVGRLLLLAVVLICANAALADPQPAPQPVQLTAATLPSPPVTAPFPELAGRGGVVIVARGGETVIAGRLQEAIAWSTIKVPIVIEGLRAGGNRADAKAAITYSDNSATDRLLLAATPPAVDRNLVRNGSEETDLNNTAWGATRWSLGEQADYAAHLACAGDTQSRQVVAWMRQPIAAHRIGLDDTDLQLRTAQKSGWGPAAGGWLVRQLAVVELGDGEVYGVALMAHADTQVDAEADLTRISRWAAQRVSELDADAC